MARDVTTNFVTTEFRALADAPVRRSRPDPTMDRAYRLGPDGPKRPLDDALIARHMRRRGFSDEEIRHVVGYLPDAEQEGASPAA